MIILRRIVDRRSLTHRQSSTAQNPAPCRTHSYRSLHESDKRRSKPSLEGRARVAVTSVQANKASSTLAPKAASRRRPRPQRRLPAAGRGLKCGFPPRSRPQSRLPAAAEQRGLNPKALTTCESRPRARGILLLPRHPPGSMSQEARGYAGAQWIDLSVGARKQRVCVAHGTRFHCRGPSQGSASRSQVRSAMLTSLSRSDGVRLHVARAERTRRQRRQRC